MRNLLENKGRRRHPFQTLNSLFFMSFRIYFRRLAIHSTEKAEHLIQRTIKLINETVNRPIKKDGYEDVNDDRPAKKIDDETAMLRDTIIQFLYQVQFDEIIDPINH
jgi:hypothetical protein